MVVFVCEEEEKPEINLAKVRPIHMHICTCTQKAERRDKMEESKRTASGTQEEKETEIGDLGKGIENGGKKRQLVGQV